ncbi:MAG TPA: RNA polymerase sigma factor [Mycobacteriales bacterium]|nr:RNA polymerase sigma factor [Mycobacteriales bacterium]
MPDAEKFELGQGGRDRGTGGGSGSRSAAHPADEELSGAVRAAQDGDADAFRILYREVQPGLLRYLRVLVGSDAEDVASEAWLQIVRDLGSFRGDADGFRGWAATIGRHRAVDLLRRRQRRPVTGPADQLAELPADSDTAGSALESLSTDAALAMIATLPQDQAEAVLLRVVMGLDAKAAARVLGKRPGAVRTAAHRGLRRLAANLAPPVAAAPAEEPAEEPPDGRTARPGVGAPSEGVTGTTTPALRRLG